MSHGRESLEGCPCGCGAAEKSHCWRESGWEESPAAKALRSENEHLRNSLRGLEQGNRELHQGIAKQKAANAKLCREADERRAAAEQTRDLLGKATGDLSRMSGEIERLRAEIVIREDGVRQAKGDVEALRSVIVRANNALYDVGPDISDAEHTIERHTDTVPAAYLRLAKGASEAWGILAAVVVDMVEPKESA